MAHEELLQSRDPQNSWRVEAPYFKDFEFPQKTKFTHETVCLKHKKHVIMYDITNCN